MDTILARAPFYNVSLTKVPTMMLVVGVGTVMEAREVTILITGSHRPLLRGTRPLGRG